MLKYNFPGEYKNLFFTLHIITIHLSYIAFFVASFSAGLYLLVNKLLKNKQIGIIFNRLPDLFFLDKLNYQAISFGFPILTLSIVAGFLWVRHTRGTYFNFNPREVYTIILWMIYALILHVRLAAKLRGMMVARLSLLAFGVIIFTLFGNCR